LPAPYSVPHTYCFVLPRCGAGCPPHRSLVSPASSLRSFVAPVAARFDVVERVPSSPSAGRAVERWPRRAQCAMPLTFATRRRRLVGWRTVVMVAVVAAVVAGVLFVVRRDTAPPPLPVAETDAFLGAWSAGNTETMAALVDAPPANLADLATSLVKAMPGST